MATIMVIEDDRGLRELICEELEAQGLECTGVETAGAARDRLATQAVDVLITDLRLPDGHGLDILALSRNLPDVPACLIITAFGSVDQAVAALKAGADDFMTKPLDLDHLTLTVQRLLEQRALRSELQRYRDIVRAQGYRGMLGSSAPMRRLFDQIPLVARADGPVLVLGESGTGKELVARALHAESPRHDAPFVAVNCAGIPSELMESEFFGHVAGAFTGARGRHQGLLLEADRGTLLLDEIGEMPLELQAKLLRVLQEGTLRPVGGSSEIAVDVRVIAATHRDITDLLERGVFREDLYYRLETFSLHVPTLREREHDLDILAHHFLRAHAAKLDKHIDGFSTAALHALHEYRFPGNVRELHNAVERAAVFCQGREITLADLPERVRGGTDIADARELGAGTLFEDLPSLQALNVRYAHYVLQQTGGNKKRAAEIMGITRRTLYRWVED